MPKLLYHPNFRKESPTSSTESELDFSDGQDDNLLQLLNEFETGLTEVLDILGPLAGILKITDES